MPRTLHRRLYQIRGSAHIVGRHLHVPLVRLACADTLGRRAPFVAAAHAAHPLRGAGRGPCTCRWRLAGRREQPDASLRTVVVALLVRIDILDTSQ